MAPRAAQNRAAVKGTAAAKKTPPKPRKPRTSKEKPGVEETIALPHERPWPRVWQGPFLQALVAVHDVSGACRIARIGRRTAYDARKPSADASEEAKTAAALFADAWDESLKIGEDNYARNLRTWAQQGVPLRKTVTTTKRNAKGETIETTVVETESVERSATIAIFYAKAFWPDRYRWAEKVEATGSGGGPIQVETIDQIDAKIAALTAELEAADQIVRA